MKGAPIIDVLVDGKRIMRPTIKSGEKTRSMQTIEALLIKQVKINS